MTENLYALLIPFRSSAYRDSSSDVLNSWGKGKFDPRYNVDGLSNMMVIPPAYGLEGIHSVTVTGDGTEVAYWNRYVAVAEMGGQGSVSEPRLNLSITNGTEDMVTSKLPALQAYQLSLKAPPAPAGSFDTAAAVRGKLVFDGAGKCATCHSGALFTDANSTLRGIGPDGMALTRTVFLQGLNSPFGMALVGKNFYSASS